MIVSYVIQADAGLNYEVGVLHTLQLIVDLLSFHVDLGFLISSDDFRFRELERVDCLLLQESDQAFV